MGTLFQRLPFLQQSNAFDGLLLLPNRAMPAADLLQLGLPMVTIGSPWPGVPCVRPDDREVGRMAAHHLARTGWRPVMVSEYPSAWQSERLAGWQAVLPNSEHVFLASDHDTLVAWLAKQAGPLALFAANDALAARLARAAGPAGRLVGQDLRLLGVDDDLMARSLRPALSSIRLPYEELGARAVAVLGELLAQGTVHGEYRASPVSLMIRASSDPCAEGDPLVHRVGHHLRIRLHEAPQRSLAELLEGCGASRSTVERAWRRVHGRSLGLSVKGLRCEVAVARLRAGATDLEKLGNSLGLAGRRGLLHALRTCMGWDARAVRALGPAKPSPSTSRRRRQPGTSPTP